MWSKIIGVPAAVLSESENLPDPHEQFNISTAVKAFISNFKNGWSGHVADFNWDTAKQLIFIHFLEVGCRYSQMDAKLLNNVCYTTGQGKVCVFYI